MVIGFVIFLFLQKKQKKHNGICPVCGRKLTIGVMNRVEELADRPSDYKDERRVPYYRLIPLDEVIAEAYKVGTAAKKVKDEYKKLIREFKNEFNVLLEVPIENLMNVTDSQVAEGIKRMREGKVKIKPGFDGEYGKIQLFEEEKNLEPQKGLF